MQTVIDLPQTDPDCIPVHVMVMPVTGSKNGLAIMDGGYLLDIDALVDAAALVVKLHDQGTLASRADSRAIQKLRDSIPDDKQPRHTHQASDVPDTCLVCGRNFRDAVHLRVGEMA